MGRYGWQAGGTWSHGTVRAFAGAAPVLSIVRYPYRPVIISSDPSRPRTARQRHARQSESPTQMTQTPSNRHDSAASGPDDQSDDKRDTRPGSQSDEVADEVANTMTDEAGDDVSGNVSDGVSDDTPDDTSDDTPGALTVRRRRLLFRAWHRGIKELDLIMGNFVEKHLDSFNHDDCAWFEALFEEQDHSVLNWVTGGDEPIPPQFQTPMMTRLQRLDFMTLKAR